jgi:hypothetical protein
MAAAIPELLGLTLGEAIAGAAGFAVAPAVRPWVQTFANEAWELHTVRPLDVGHAAEIAAQYRVFENRARAEGRKQGIDDKLMDNLILALREAPALEGLMTLWRRDLINEATVDFGLAKLKIAERFREPLKDTKNLLLSPADLAMMRQQGFIDRDRQVNESSKQGVTPERADLLFEISGLPPPTERAMEMLRRGIITEAQFRKAIVEGHEKTKYTDEELALRRELLHPATLVALYLKGWIERPDYHARMALHGYDATEADDWYDSAGRPAAPGQMATAAVRGIDGPDGRPMDRAQFLKGIRESDIRPEWGPMLWDARFLYPSLFQLTRLVTSGTIDGDTGADWAHKARYAPEVVTALRASWDRPAARTAKGLTATDLANEYEARWLTRAQYVAGLKEIGYSQDRAEAKAEAEDSRRARAARDKRIELIGSRYVGHGIGRERAVTELTNAGVPARVRDGLLLEWDVMRELTPDAFTSAQIRKAYRNAQITRAEAITRLELRRYDERDANLYLDE